MLPFAMGSALTGSLPSIAAGSSGASLTGILQGLGGAGQFLGGLGSLFGNDGQSFDLNRWKYMQYYSNRMQRQANVNRLSDLIRTSRSLGISPLAAMGVSSAPTSPVQAFGSGGSNKNIGRALANMGAGISKLGQDPLTKAQMRRLNAETRLLEAQAANIGRVRPATIGDHPMTRSSSTPISPGVQAKYVAPQKFKQSGPGREAGEQASEAVTFSPEGNLIRRPTEGLEDFVSEDLLTKIRFHYPEYKRWVDNEMYQTWAPNHSGAIKNRNNLRLLISDLTRSHPPPRGMMYVFDEKFGTIARVPKKKFHRLYRYSNKYGMKAEFWTLPQKRRKASRIKRRSTYKRRGRESIMRNPLRR